MLFHVTDKKMGLSLSSVIDQIYSRKKAAAQRNGYLNGIGHIVGHLIPVQKYQQESQNAQYDPDHYEDP